MERRETLCFRRAFARPASRGKFISVGGPTLPLSAPTLFSTCPKIAGLTLLPSKPSRDAARPSCKLHLHLRTKSEEYCRGARLLASYST
jgi:hypothetical protein